MRRLFLYAALIASLIGGAALAQTAPAALFSADRFRAHVAFLSDDLLEGRDTGSRGYDIGAAYVAAQFESIGLKPGGEKGGWYQTVPFRAAELGRGVARVTVSGPAGSHGWDNGTQVILRPSTAEAVQDVAAPVVFVGYGIDAPDQGSDDYRGLDVSGKIVAVLAGAPSDVPSELAAHFGNQKAAMAQRHGAIGMITIGTALSDRTTAWDVRVRHSGGRRMTWLGPDAKPGDDAPAVRATATFNTPASDALFAGAPQSYAAVRAEADRAGARPRGFALKTKARIRRSSVWTSVTSREVIGVLPGSDPKLRDEYVVLMGHLDHLGLRPGAKPGEDNVYNGALDNAAGIATMLETARAFVESGDRPRRSILFIANTAEEKGLLGADFFARHPTVPIGKIIAAVDLDMPLLLYDFTDVIAFGGDHSTVGQAIARAAGSMGVKLSPDPMPEESIFVRSDHYMFVKQGVPAIMLATGFANGGAAQWKKFLGNVYHNVGDDMAQPIHWNMGAKFARLNYLISRELADSDARPMWYQDDYFGTLYAPEAPKAARPR